MQQNVYVEGLKHGIMTIIALSLYRIILYLYKGVDLSLRQSSCR